MRTPGKSATPRAALRRMSALAASGVLSAAVFSLVSCFLFQTYSGEILTGERSIRVDVQSSLFHPYGEPAEEPWTWGLGARSVQIIVTTDAGEFDKELRPGSVDPVFRYTPLSVSVSGTLVSVTALVTMPDETVFTAVLDRVTDGSAWAGWQTFANLTKFRLSAEPDPEDRSGSVVALDVCPRGGLSLLTDNAGVDADFARTDRGAGLAAGQVSLQPQFLENPTGLTYRVYYAIAEENLRELYSVHHNFDATYLEHPWEDLWTVRQMTETGRIIGEGPEIELVAYGTDAFDAANPMGDGLASILLDFSTGENAADLIGQYLVAGIVVSHGTLSVASRMVCVEIR